MNERINAMNGDGSRFPQPVGQLDGMNKPRWCSCLDRCLIDMSPKQCWMLKTLYVISLENDYVAVSAIINLEIEIEQSISHIMLREIVEEVVLSSGR
jgi:hypothetical protein